MIDLNPMGGCAGCGIEEQGIGWPDAAAFLCRECAGPFEDPECDPDGPLLGVASIALKLKGETPLGAAVAMRAANGMFWVNQRSGTESHKGCWQIPGGGVNDNESPFQAVIREAKEETGLDIDPKRVILLGRSKAVKGTARQHTIYGTWWFLVDLAHNEVPIHMEKDLCTPWVLKTADEVRKLPQMPRMHEAMERAVGTSRVDPDLLRMNEHVLRACVMHLRTAIRADRDVTGHNYCWFRPELWKMLPEGYDITKVGHGVPPWPEFMAKCAEFRASFEKPKAICMAERMKAIAALPPPGIAEVEAQLAASARTTAVQAAIDSYREGEGRSPLLMALLDQVIGLRCPSCHESVPISVTIPWPVDA